MVSVMIVDDEMVERQGLRYFFAQSGYACALHEARNGLEALKALSETPCQMLITDIRMPFMDGLTLSAKARELNPEMVILLYTAYGEFEYARQAIQCQVFSYLMKPLTYCDFYEQIGNAIAACEQARENRLRQRAAVETFCRAQELEEKQLWKDALFTDISGEEAEARLERVAGGAKHPCLPLICFRIPAFEGAKRPGETGIHWWLDPAHKVTLEILPARPSKAELAQRAAALRDSLAPLCGNTSVVCACPPGGIRTLRRDYQRMLTYAKEPMLDYGHVVILEDEADAPPEGDARENDAISKILAYVHAHYAEPLTLRTIARAIYVSEGYVGSLFSRRTGIRLMKYVAKYRMERAARLLMETDLRVTEIAARVGYDSPAYFTSVFSDSYGVTPLAYRQRAKDGEA